MYQETWKEYLGKDGFIYSEMNGYWVKGYGWGKSITVDYLFRGLFEIRKDNKVFFSDFIKSFKQFKNIIKTVQQ